MINHIFCIALDKRDKERTIDKEFEKYGLFVDLFKCGDGSIYDSYHYIDKKVGGREQAYNYGQILRTLCMVARNSSLDNFLLLEDDAEINPRYKENFLDRLNCIWDNFLKLNTEWDMLYLGGNWQCATKLEWVTEQVIKANYILDMQAVIFNKTCFDKIIEINPSNEVTIDGVIASAQKEGKIGAFTACPVLITQKDCFSYNENRFVSRKENHIL